MAARVLPRGRAAQASYVQSLLRAGAVGLGFGTGLRFAAVPVGVVAVGSGGVPPGSLSEPQPWR